jgi:hypothetical protein
VQSAVSARLGAEFVPYSLDQVHGTLVLLAGGRDQSGVVINQHYLEYRGERRPMDFGRVLRLLDDHLAEPLTIRIGGFLASDRLPFTSQGRHLHERSFTGHAGALVLMGWPAAALESAGRLRPLDELRRAMTEAGVLHRYHRAPGDVDDDFHLVIGHYGNAADPGAVAAAVSAVRVYLADHPVELRVSLDDVRIIAADSPTLAAPRFCAGLPLAASQLARLYD